MIHPLPTRVIALNRLSPMGMELVLERNKLTFRAGQLINLHGRNYLEDRSYTICSGEADPFLSVLFRLIPSGVLTPQLASLKAGDLIDISGPYGEFTVRDPTCPIVFIATGTGIAPCRAYLRSNPGLTITLIHGVRDEKDLYYRDEMSRTFYHPCVTAGKAPPGIYSGRVTDCARSMAFPENSHYYLCGANEMIYEMKELLEARGISRSCIFSEEYYYRSNEA